VDISAWSAVEVDFECDLERANAMFWGPDGLGSVAGDVLAADFLAGDGLSSDVVGGDVLTAEVG
jgi:hypothetical protein